MKGTFASIGAISRTLPCADVCDENKKHSDGAKNHHHENARVLQHKPNWTKLPLQGSGEGEKSILHANFIARFVK